MPQRSTQPNISEPHRRITTTVSTIDCYPLNLLLALGTPPAAQMFSNSPPNYPGYAPGNNFSNYRSFFSISDVQEELITYPPSSFDYIARLNRLLL